MSMNDRVCHDVMKRNEYDDRSSRYDDMVDGLIARCGPIDRCTWRSCSS